MNHELFLLMFPTMEPLSQFSGDYDLEAGKSALVTEFAGSSTEDSLENAEGTLELGLRSPNKPIVPGSLPGVKKRAQDIGHFRCQFAFLLP